MGENARYNGELIKIGTCEDLYYLRADQVTDPRLSWEPNSLNPLDPETLKVIRFRFPFPEEDNITPGLFPEFDHGVGVHGVFPPREIEHCSIQFADTRGRGLLVSLPCPESGAGRFAEYTVHYNNYRGKVRLVQQAARGGVLAIVCECGSCGAKYSLPELAEAQPIIDYFFREAERVAAENQLYAATWNYTVAKRIKDGYTNPPVWARV